MRGTERSVFETGSEQGGNAGDKHVEIACAKVCRGPTKAAMRGTERSTFETGSEVYRAPTASEQEQIAWCARLTDSIAGGV